MNNSVILSWLNKSKYVGLDDLTKVQIDLIKAESEVFKAQIANPQFKAVGEQNNNNGDENDDDDDNDNDDGDNN